MNAVETAGLILAALTFWFWLDSMRAREAAISAAKLACKTENLQLLDDTVAIARLRLARNSDGQLRIHRIYRFEYTDTGDNRLTGSIAMLGGRVLMTQIDTLDLTRPDLLH